MYTCIFHMCLCVVSSSAPPKQTFNGMKVHACRVSPLFKECSLRIDFLITFNLSLSSYCHFSFCMYVQYVTLSPFLSFPLAPFLRPSLSVCLHLFLSLSLSISLSLPPLFLSQSLCPGLSLGLSLSPFSYYFLKFCLRKVISRSSHYIVCAMLTGEIKSLLSLLLFLQWEHFTAFLGFFL